ncbi:endonuclease domain-containing protein [Pelagibacterium limicola]|uniref:endonuclease domain-containing protein n=1 Tax=Pelagibacterium limicola TaxID=2791022 RepID=UPI0018AFE665|nr:endonuclease domain-containing protein [Pelagibacterium limicola]
MTETVFTVERPRFDPRTGAALFGYRLGELSFTEKLEFPVPELGAEKAASGAFAHLLDLTAAVLGVSYFKLLAPLDIDLTALSLAEGDAAFLTDVYENGLGEFYARNALERFGRLRFRLSSPRTPTSSLTLLERTLVLIGGGKDSLVSVDLLERAGKAITLFAVNPKGPILSTAQRSGHEMIGVTRTLDPEMIRLSKEEGYYNGHVPSTAINSMIAALAASLYGFDTIILSNERSASEGNIAFDGRETNHQHSKSLDFERLIGGTLARASGGGLGYFSLLRPYSEARIGQLFARTSRYDDVFSSCNANFRLGGNKGPLWCGKCPKCHFVFLVLAPWMTYDRLTAIFGQDVLDNPENIPAYRELTGLSGHKPWECVGEILEAAACLWRLTGNADWRNCTVVATLRPELEAFYGQSKLETAFEELMTDSPDHLIPASFQTAVASHAA